MKNMKVTVSETKGLKTNLNVLVKKQEIDKKIEERVIELQKTINIKGFRPGKAPVDLLKKQFAQALYGEVLEKILQDNTYQALSENKSIKVTINGHADNVGEEGINNTISENRAINVKNILTSNGVDASRISTKGFGDKKPKESNDTEKGRNANRRAEIITTIK